MTVEELLAQVVELLQQEGRLSYRLLKRRFGIDAGQQAVQHSAYTEATAAVCSEHGFPSMLALGTISRGGALLAQAQWAEGIAQMRQGLEAYPGEFRRTGYLAWLAEGYRGAGQVEEGVAAIAEALRLVDKNDERYYEVEVWRIKGQLVLESGVRTLKTLAPKLKQKRRRVF